MQAGRCAKRSPSRDVERVPSPISQSLKTVRFKKVKKNKNNKSLTQGTKDRGGVKSREGETTAAAHNLEYTQAHWIRLQGKKAHLFHHQGPLRASPPVPRLFVRREIMVGPLDSLGPITPVARLAQTELQVRGKKPSMPIQNKGPVAPRRDETKLTTRRPPPSMGARCLRSLPDSCTSCRGPCKDEAGNRHAPPPKVVSVQRGTDIGTY